MHHRSLGRLGSPGFSVSVCLCVHFDEVFVELGWAINLEEGVLMHQALCAITCLPEMGFDVQLHPPILGAPLGFDCWG